MKGGVVVSLGQPWKWYGLGKDLEEQNWKGVPKGNSKGEIMAEPY